MKLQPGESSKDASTAAVACASKFSNSLSSFTSSSTNSTLTVALACPEPEDMPLAPFELAATCLQPEQLHA